MTPARTISPLAVGIAQEGVECAGALREPCGQRIPLVSRDEPGHRVDDERIAAEAHPAALEAPRHGPAQAVEVAAFSAASISA